MSVEPAQCPYCGVAASGRFCSACGKEVTLHTTSSAVLRDTLGVKAPPLKAIAATAWMTILQPATLTLDWIAGRRQGLVSPVVMMSTVTVVTAVIGFLLIRLTGNAPDETPLQFGELLRAAPFLDNTRARVLALRDDAGMVAQFKATGSYLAAFWPLLFIAPGYIALAPWRRVTSPHALILACVESVFLLIVTGVWSSLRLVAPAAAQSGWTSLLFWIVVAGHGAAHIKSVTGSGWSYAISRPCIAAIVFPIVGYLFVVLVMALTLTAATG